ncbi:hypothetical protein FACS189450_10100 [Spirochaetia bacterium]|nr:hypothetical protein FACS189450_10100 [Spirochaetia bacterium]
MNKLNILILSSVSPYTSTNVGLDIMRALETAGHNVDYLTKYKFKNMLPNMYSVFDCVQPESKIAKLRKLLPVLKNIHKPSFLKKQAVIKNQVLFDDDELPSVDPYLIIKKITKEYDIIITHFWHYMITAETLKNIHEKLHCPIFILIADMIPMTGGCFYFWDCKNFISFCGRCPALNSTNEDDQTHKNMLFKKNVYQSIDYYILGNTWICNKALQNPLFNENRIKKAYGLINENIFKSRGKNDVRKYFGIDSKKKYILFAGAQSFSEKRKGFDILIQSINNFVSGLSPEKKDELLLLVAGNTAADIHQYFHIDVCCLGYLDTESLAIAYSASDCYLSTTIEDAGPLMVCQAVMSGIPVVAFEVGAALDIIVTGVTGYKAKLKDIEDYTKGILEIYNYTDSEREMTSLNCRKNALEKYSYKAFSNRIEEIYGEYKNCRT